MEWFSPSGLEKDSIPYFPVTSWIPILLANRTAMDLLIGATETPGYIHIYVFVFIYVGVTIFNRKYSDITTGSWYKGFAAHCTMLDSIPVPLDTYYDDWKVSNLNSVGGLYFTFATYTRQTHWQVQHKYLISLIPHGAKVQDILPKMLEDVGLNSTPREATFADGVVRRILLSIARVICDTPGVSSFCETSGHAGGRFIFLCNIISPY